MGPKSQPRVVRGDKLMVDELKKLPRVVNLCIEYIEQFGLREKGLFEVRPSDLLPLCDGGQSLMVPPPSGQRGQSPNQGVSCPGCTAGRLITAFCVCLAAPPRAAAY